MTAAVMRAVALCASNLQTSAKPHHFWTPWARGRYAGDRAWGEWAARREASAREPSASGTRAASRPTLGGGLSGGLETAAQTAVPCYFAAWEPSGPHSPHTQ